ncbi:21146_t:CDS:2 [Entrophospora sp. SA101]|nr:21146_t:CDS:2 [Entrophospora sp. SA101]
MLKASSCKPIPAINQDVVNMEGQFALMRSFTIPSNYDYVYESGI